MNANRIIKISNNRFYYTESDYLSLEQTNLHVGKLKFSNRQDIYWEVELKDYDKTSNSVEIYVLNYEPKVISNFKKQVTKKSLDYFKFMNLEWESLEPLLSSYQPIALTGLFKMNTGKHQISPDDLAFPKELNITKVKSSFKENTEYNSDDLIQDVQQEFFFAFKNASFENGYVSVYKKFDFLPLKIELKIYNENILKEYDYIKYYFPKYFKDGKKFRVKFKGKIQYGELISYSANSPEIDSINDEIIKIVKSYRSVELINVVTDSTDEESLFTIEEVVERINVSDEIKKGFETNEKEIIDSILLIRKVRNKRQLEYLSGKKQSETERIRFTLRPLFGFLFLINGKKMNHFCWELLDSHATYIWSFDSNFLFSEKINEIDNIINTVRTVGRDTYKREWKKMKENSNFIFKTINHKVNKVKNDGFIDWKNRLEEILT